MAFPIAAAAQIAGPALLSGAANVGIGRLQDKSKDVDGKPGADGFTKGNGFLASAGTVAGGAGIGAAMKLKDLDPDASRFDKMKAGITGGLAGAGAGFLADMQRDATHAKGGALKAMVAGAGANMLSSTLQKGGPNMLQSAIAGGATAYMGNSMHDKLTDKGYDLQADAVADGMEGATLGYTAEGGLKGAGIGLAAGGIGGALSNKLNGNKEPEAAKGLGQMQPQGGWAGATPDSFAGAAAGGLGGAKQPAFSGLQKQSGDEGFSL